MVAPTVIMVAALADGNFRFWEISAIRHLLSWTPDPLLGDILSPLGLASPLFPKGKAQVYYHHVLQT